jgi:CubicO group peptidase (beta-lactamase class C family)
MKKFVVALLLALPLFGQAARGNPDMSFGGETVDAMIAAFMKEHDVPGMAVAIVQAPYVTRVTGFGLADRERRTLVADNTVFDVGQMKNAYTAVAVMQLVEMGKIKLDDVREKLRTADPSLEQLVEKASGVPYEEFVRKNQFERVGLRHTFFGADLARVPHAKINPIEPATGSGKPAPRAIYASARDVSLWDIALAGDLLIKDPAMRAVLYVPGDAKRVGAWEFPGRRGLMIATGSANGFSALLSRYTDPSELVCVTLLANKEGLDLHALAERIAAAHNANLAPAK